jgi:hypothetical protein
MRNHHDRPVEALASVNQTQLDLPHALPIGKPFQRFSGIGRTTAYQLNEIGEIETFLIGSRRYILVSSYLDYIERQRTKETARRAGGKRPTMRGAAR